MSFSNDKRLIHGNPKLHPCIHCEYKSKSKQHCEMHIKSIHEKFKETCKVCGKQFSNLHNLNRHKRKCHLEVIQSNNKKKDIVYDLVTPNEIRRVEEVVCPPQTKHSTEKKYYH